MTDIAQRRVTALLDAGSFRPFASPGFSFATIRSAVKVPPAGPAVVAGFGSVDGRPAAVFASRPEVSGGAVGLAEAAAVCALMDEAEKRKCPIVGLLHSGGARIQEGVDSLAGYAEIFARNTRLSGVVPQISVILGPCAGGAVYSPALTDFVIMTEGQGEMFITGPDVIRQTTGETTDRASLGGSAVHLRKSGVAHFGAPTEEESFALRKLLAHLPSHRDARAPATPARDADRKLPELDVWLKKDRRLAFEVRTVVESVVDEGAFLEVQKEFAHNILAGFARLAGEAVGVVANNSAHLAGALDIDASTKAARFVRTCAAFNLPVVTFVDVPGYWPGVAQEHGGIIRHGAKLLHAYAEAEVPKLTVILRKAYGGAYDVMSSKHLGADYNAAWPTAELAVMGPRGAVEIIHRKELAASPDPERLRAEKMADYVKEFVNPDMGLRGGYVDEVIAPSDTRAKLCANLKRLLAAPPRPRPPRGNIPL
jgi:propionyl-CoA carboxylase beta chain